MKFIVGIFTLLLFSGCASTAGIQEVYDSAVDQIDQELKSSGKAKVIVVREKALLQSMAGLDIYIDGQWKASVNNNSEASIIIEPGVHKIEGKMGSLDGKSGCGFEFNAVKGEVVRILASPSKTGAGLPIVSILANPLVCKFNE